MRKIFTWTLADFRALPRLWMMDLRRKWARLLLDWFGQDIEMEQAYRYWLRRAKETGAAIYCLNHDCAWENCPKGCHDDDETEKN